MRIGLDGDTLILSNLGPYYEMVKSFGGLKWDKTSKTMRGTASIDLLEKLSSVAILPGEAEELLHNLKTIKAAVDRERMADEPYPTKYPVKVNLFRHQLRGANMAMLEFDNQIHKGFGFLFEMGCGKTLTAIAVMGGLYIKGKIKRVLIAAPTSVCSVWPKELSEYADFPFRAALMQGDKNKRLASLDSLTAWNFDGVQVAVINYESTFREGIFEALKDFSPDMIIADESQRIKNPTASQSKAMHALGDIAKYKLILSGTPVQNNAIDLYSQYRFMDSSVFGKNFYAFKSRYCRMGGYENHQIIGYRNLDELTMREYSAAYRVTKQDCLDLPEQTYINRYLEFSPSDRKVYDRLKKESFAELDCGDRITAPTVLTKLLRLQQLTGGFLQSDESDKPKQVNTLKLDALEEIIDDYVIEAGKKLVVFARFRPEISAIEEMLEKKKIRHGSIYGDIPISERGVIVDDFQNNPDTKVFVAQLQTAGLGITLHAASAAVFYSIDFNYANYTQATARIHRIGQKQPCTYIHLMVDKSIDDKVLDAIKHKDNLAKSIVDDWRRYFTED